MPAAINILSSGRLPVSESNTTENKTLKLENAPKVLTFPDPAIRSSPWATRARTEMPTSMTTGCQEFIVGILNPTAIA